VLAVKDSRRVVYSLRPNLLVDEEWCDVHGVNLAKTASKDLCTMTGKSYSIAAVFRTANYCQAAIARVATWVRANVRRHRGIPPNADVVSENRRFLDLIFDLDSESHLHRRPDGIVTKSALLEDLELSLTLENGKLQQGWVDHYCFDPETKRPCCQSENDMFDRFVLLYIRMFLGHAWPLPSIGKFTYTRSIMRKVALGYLFHNILCVFIEPYTYPGQVHLPWALILLASLVVVAPPFGVAVVRHAE
jgi:hypothetical protein